MTARSRLPLAVISLAALLVASPIAGAAGPLPDLPASPALPDVPTVTVTPDGSGGATVGVGAGDTALQVGAGPGGLTVGTRSRGSKPGAGSGNPVDSVPVSTPGDRRGRSGKATAGPGAVVFGAPSTGGRAVRLDGRHAGSRPGSTSAPANRHNARFDTLSPGGRENSRLAPFLEFIDRVPLVVKVGVGLLALIALAMWAAWVRARRRLAQNAFVDPVTGIANAAAFEGLLDRELERAKRYKRPLALILLDVGAAEHPGLLPLRDQTAREVASAIRGRIREGDTIVRLGSSRFAVISPEATASSAKTLARALELRLEQLRVHVSVGTAERQPTDFGPGDLAARAEADLTQSSSPAGEPARLRPALRAA
jgi:diguanylate cyclase (GGDEF)-like protein